MAKVEVSHTERQGKNIPGNKWEFSERNDFLTPTLYPRSIDSYEQMTDALRDFIFGLNTLTQPGWRFQALLVRNDGEITGNYNDLVAVYTNPLKINKSHISPPLEDFIQPQFLAFGMLDGDLQAQAIEPFLVDTNCIPALPYADYNEIAVQERKRFWRKKQTTSVYQTGVAYVRCGLRTLDEEMKIIDEVASTFGEYLENVPVLLLNKAEREQLEQKRTPYPKKLF